MTFRQEPLFTEWLAIVGPFVAAPPVGIATGYV